MAKPIKQTYYLGNAKGPTGTNSLLYDSNTWEVRVYGNEKYVNVTAKTLKVQILADGNRVARLRRGKLDDDRLALWFREAVLSLTQDDFATMLRSIRFCGYVEGGRVALRDAKGGRVALRDAKQRFDDVFKLPDVDETGAE